MKRSEQQRSSATIGILAIAALAAALGMNFCAVPAAQAQTYQVLHYFTNGADGREPVAGLSMDGAGNLYGTASLGGANYCGGNGCGVVFKLTKHAGGWVFSTLYNFSGDDGRLPSARVIFGPDGNLYGTTPDGGNNDLCTELFGGCGVVFKLSPPPSICRSTSCPWTETVLHRFNGDDGALPSNEVVFDHAGNLYGTTEFGGTNNQCLDGYGLGCGNVFQLTPAQGPWTETVLYNFLSNGSDGTQPLSNLIFDGSGNLYGTTSAGGTTGAGTVFELTPSGGGWNESVLFGQFTLNNNTGEEPVGGVIFDPAGNLYGTTSYGSYYGDTAGTVFKMTPGSGGWAYDVLYTIPSNEPQIGGPVAGLTRDAAGNLYGTTRTGGMYGAGQVFKITSDGSVTSLHDFVGYDGCGPASNVILDSQGNLYGTAAFCGQRNNCSIGCGVVWEITP